MKFHPCPVFWTGKKPDYLPQVPVLFFWQCISAAETRVEPFLSFRIDLYLVSVHPCPSRDD
jgi:hypothetical protein